jgi:uncharacterized lipoprotein YehR (DUF1307 family)
MRLKELIQEARADIANTKEDAEKHLSKSDPYFYALAFGMMEEKIRYHLEKIETHAKK